MQSKVIELIVGLFMLAGLVGLMILAFRVSGLSDVHSRDYYQLKAEFDNIGDLKVRSPVRISGVKVGQISAIILDHQTFKAEVIMQVKKQVTLPVDSAASIFTQGLLGSNYISLAPGYEAKQLKPGEMIGTTHSALILENLIGQLIYNLKSGK